MMGGFAGAYALAREGVVQRVSCRMNAAAGREISERRCQRSLATARMALPEAGGGACLVLPTEAR